ncbi:hypothetical protein ATANTOWER_027859 [Ataeniobius toweri]|uniref:Uncharacterized protein n=1 Tax=Ataeniobius toweri TaxID=208326 RepID=A0ABU7A3B2_9TELE|nr:hypothetical protein [Ataeniobius toweri]
MPDTRSTFVSSVHRVFPEGLELIKMKMLSLGAVGCHCAAPGEHSGAKGLAQGPRVVICGIRTRPLVSPPERKPPVLTTRPPLK